MFCPIAYKLLSKRKTLGLSIFKNKKIDVNHSIHFFNLVISTRVPLDINFC